METMATENQRNRTGSIIACGSEVETMEDVSSCHLFMKTEPACVSTIDEQSEIEGTDVLHDPTFVSSEVARNLKEESDDESSDGWIDSETESSGEYGSDSQSMPQYGIHDANGVGGEPNAEDHCERAVGMQLKKKVMLRKRKAAIRLQKQTAPDRHVHRIRRYQCEVCCKRFQCPSFLKRHMLKHTGERPYKCSQCDKAYKAKRSLIKHVKSHETEEKKQKTSRERKYMYLYQCEVRPKKFRCPSNVSRHMLKHTRYKLYECSQCDKAYLEKNALIRHVKIHETEEKRQKTSIERKYQCEVCQKRFRFPSHLNAHMLTHTGERPYKCSQCDKAYTEKRGLLKHVKNHGNMTIKQKASIKKNNQCEVCQKRWQSPSHVRRHMITHTGERPFKCSQCDKDYTEKRGLIKHLKIHKSEERKQKTSKETKYMYKCEVCQKRCLAPSHVKIHMLKHTGERPYKCSQCDKAYTEKRGLLKHVKTHENEKRKPKASIKKNYQCEVCQKRFQSPAHVNIHMITHTGERPFKCSQCDKDYTEKRGLIKHLETHKTEERKQKISNERKYMYKCEVCQKRFQCPSHVNRHMITHTGERPFKCSQFDNAYREKRGLLKPVQIHEHEKRKQKASKKKNNQCEVCHKRLQSPSHVRRHMITHTGERPYKCSQCDKAYTEKRGLLKHVKTHENEKRKPKASIKKNYQCEVCQKRFQSPAHVNIHMITHTGERPYKCSKCDKAYTEKRGLIKHLETHKTEERKQKISNERKYMYKCEVCQKRFQCPSHVKIHMLKHAGERPYKCSQCDNAYTEKRGLLEHVKIHETGKRKQKTSRERKYWCYLCHQKLSTWTSLVKHKLSHRGEKWFKCSYCHKAYSNKRNFMKHHLTHRKAANLFHLGKAARSGCVKELEQKSVLTRHLKLCENAYSSALGEETPKTTARYRCDVCQKAFFRLFQLIMHKQTHKREEPFKCPVSTGQDSANGEQTWSNDETQERNDDPLLAMTDFHFECHKDAFIEEDGWIAEDDGERLAGDESNGPDYIVGDRASSSDQSEDGTYVANADPLQATTDFQTHFSKVLPCSVILKKMRLETCIDFVSNNKVAVPVCSTLAQGPIGCDEEHHGNGASKGKRTENEDPEQVKIGFRTNVPEGRVFSPIHEKMGSGNDIAAVVDDDDDDAAGSTSEQDSVVGQEAYLSADAEERDPLETDNPLLPERLKTHETYTPTVQLFPVMVGKIGLGDYITTDNNDDFATCLTPEEDSLSHVGCTDGEFLEICYPYQVMPV